MRKLRSSVKNKRVDDGILWDQQHLKGAERREACRGDRLQFGHRQTRWGFGESQGPGSLMQPGITALRWQGPTSCPQTHFWIYFHIFT